MNTIEYAFEREMLKKVAALRPGVLVFKHADKHRVGMPDRSFTDNGRTVWVELKRRVKGENLLDLFRPVQIPTCIKLQRASEGRCWIVVFTVGGPGWDRTTIYSPWELIRTTPPVPRLAAEGHDHDAVAQLIEEGLR